MAFSCQGRGFYPSCAVKREAIFGTLSVEEVIGPVGLCLWTSTMPKMLRPYLRARADSLRVALPGSEEVETTGPDAGECGESAKSESCGGGKIVTVATAGVG